MTLKKTKVACVLLASGNSLRFESSKSKLFYKVHRTPIIEITLKNLTKYLNKDSIYITISKKITKNEKKLLLKYTKNQLVYGGKTRFESLKMGLKNINSNNYDLLMIHDAARPTFTKDIINALLSSMNSKRYHCAVPASKIEDTIRKKNKSIVRNDYKYYQTPQVFKFRYFKNNLEKIKINPTDDLGVIEKNKGLKIKYIEANKENIKITKKNDIGILKKILNFNIRYGSGFDIHKLKSGNYLSLAGLKIRCNYQAIGHSDGDVVIHSIIDALLGANSKGDIGAYFPPTKKNKNISSVSLLDEIKKIIKLDNAIISNLDCTIICQKIRLEKYKKLIRKNISSLMQCDEKSVNVKAKTADNIGILGKSKAIACWTTIKIMNL
jgi:2-C-methyl-D-erythritol 4-phosphate cytidylyltransferase/2-C-methyl-D-erythritol 2,4-cyclodiphosphate synthase